MRGPGSRRNRYLLAQEFGPALGPPERPEQFRDYYTVHPHRPEDRRFTSPRPTIRYITPRGPTPPTPPTNHNESKFRLESELEPLDEETFKKPSQTQTGHSAPGERRITKDGTYLEPTDSKYILDTDSLPELLRLTNISSQTDSTLLQTDSHY